MANMAAADLPDIAATLAPLALRERGWG